MRSTIVVFLWRRSMRMREMGFVRTRCTVLWPHEMFAAIYANHRDKFEKYILGGEHRNIEEFWATMPSRDGMVGRPRWRTHCVPLALHGDGVAVANIRGKSNKTVDVLSWTSLLGGGGTRASWFLIWMCFAHLAKKTGLATTWRSFWRQLCRSLRALWAGVFPDVQVDGSPEPRAGRPLAGGYFAVLYCNKGDLEWMASHFGLARTTARQPCALCRCGNTGHDVHPWTDVNNPPSWEAVCYSDEAGANQNLVSMRGLWGSAALRPDSFFLLVRFVRARCSNKMFSECVRVTESLVERCAPKPHMGDFRLNSRLLMCDRRSWLRRITAILCLTLRKRLAAASPFLYPTTCIPRHWARMPTYSAVSLCTSYKRCCLVLQKRTFCCCGRACKRSTPTTDPAAELAG